MNVIELQERYKSMETEELISIAFSSEEEYTKEAIQVAKAELKHRNVSLEENTTISIAKEIKQKREKEGVDIKTRSLTKTQKIWFTILPKIAFFYMIFVLTFQKEKEQRIKDATKCFYWGLALWLTIALIIWLLKNNSLY